MTPLESVWVTSRVGCALQDFVYDMFVRSHVSDQY